MKVTRAQTLKLAKKHKVDKKYALSELYKGINVELEHVNVTHGDLDKTMKIVIAHLKELPDYYKRLKAMEKK
jgi:hypothetical protein